MTDSLDTFLESVLSSQVARGPSLHSSKEKGKRRKKERKRKHTFVVPTVRYSNTFHNPAKVTRESDNSGSNNLLEQQKYIGINNTLMVLWQGLVHVKLLHFGACMKRAPEASTTQAVSVDQKTGRVLLRDDFFLSVGYMSTDPSFS
jgi:hypothetical protein